MQSLVTEFYYGRDPDHRGRMIGDILEWDNDALESTHDYIQWLFPSDFSSMHCAYAPLLTEEDPTTFRVRPELMDKVVESFARMARFYGFAWIRDPRSGKVTVGYSDDWEDRRAVWLTPDNHNYLRLTRILRFLCTVGLNNFAHGLLRRLWTVSLDNPNIISDKTIAYWTSAVT